jgi:3-dehydroquinate synthase
VITLHCRPAHEPPSEVVIGPGAVAALAEPLRTRAAFVYRDPAAPLPAALAALPQLAHADGESGKTLAGCERLLRAMSAAGLDRGGLLIACGGGVVGDVGGLAAALYLRGIEFWQVPTTLLAMVDSSVGGKTAVNLPEGKNLVGALHPAARVFVDVELLDGLPEREYRSGLAEALKMGIGCDAELFAHLERHADAILARDLAALDPVVVRSIAAKIAVVERDPREQGPRRLLNLGHTLGHALEAHSGFLVPHGHCVARGLHFALGLAAAAGLMPAAQASRAQALLARYGHPRTPLPPVDELLPFLARDKKVIAGAVQFVLPTGIGSACQQAMPLAALQAALAADVAS